MVTEILLGLAIGALMVALIWGIEFAFLLWEGARFNQQHENDDE